MGFRDLGIFTHKHWGLTNNAPRDFSDLSNKSGFNCNKRVYIYTYCKGIYHDLSKFIIL